MSNSNENSFASGLVQSMSSMLGALNSTESAAKNIPQVTLPGKRGPNSTADSSHMKFNGHVS
jgi:hypothetical protein